MQGAVRRNAEGKTAQVAVDIEGIASLIVIPIPLNRQESGFERDRLCAGSALDREGSGITVARDGGMGVHPKRIALDEEVIGEKHQQQHEWQAEQERREPGTWG